MKWILLELDFYLRIKQYEVNDILKNTMITIHIWILTVESSCVSLQTRWRWLCNRLNRSALHAANSCLEKESAWFPGTTPKSQKPIPYSFGKQFWSSIESVFFIIPYIGLHALKDTRLVSGAKFPVSTFHIRFVGLLYRFPLFHACSEGWCPIINNFNCFSGLCLQTSLFDNFSRIIYTNL